MADDDKNLVRIEALAARVETLQTCMNSNSGRLDRVESNVTSLLKQVGVMESILEGNVKVQEKLSTMLENFGNTLNDFRVTLVEIKINLENIAGKVKEVEDDTENLTERGHFDFIKWVKENLVTILLGLGTAWAVIQSIIEAATK